MKKLILFICAVFITVSIMAQSGTGLQAQIVTKVKLLPDTASYTNAFTLQLSDGNKWISVIKSTYVAVTIPPNADVAIPVGTTINFVQGGAGQLLFKAGSGVIKQSFKDSTATDGIWSWAALYKRGTNHWILYGNIGQ